MSSPDVLEADPVEAFLQCAGDVTVRTSKTSSTLSLWEGLGPDTVSRAVFSRDERYRYLLTRTWGGGPRIAWVMLNPSTADERVNDPTVARCCAFSMRWGAGGLVVANLFALRATDPDELKATAFPGGDAVNDAAIRMALIFSARAIAAWGVHGRLMARGEIVRRIAEELGVHFEALGETKDGEPRHPLYVHGSTRPKPYERKGR